MAEIHGSKLKVRIKRIAGQVAGGIAMIEEENNHELSGMTRRFWICAALSLPVFLLAMGHLLPSAPHWVAATMSRWIDSPSLPLSCSGAARPFSLEAGAHSAR